MERDIPLLSKTEAQLGDVVRLVGLPGGVKNLADELGHTLIPGAGYHLRRHPDPPCRDRGGNGNWWWLPDVRLLMSLISK